ncbi:restriction endonuclease subunit S [Aeoliella sp. SH292]|uniref:restriction endonuclease subunit S n=1 Tax=Aeoliella sp. SH292 TaxID=3454464 RepID=UPI003F98BF16
MERVVRETTPAQMLLDNLEIFATAPGGVAKLRELILELGLRGQLTQQLAGESALPLLDTVRVARQKLMDEGVLKTAALVEPVSPKDIPYELPASWEWIQIGDALRLFNGRAFKPTEWSTSGLPIIRIQNLNNPNAPYNYCNFDVGEKFHVRAGDFLISWSGTPGTSFGAFVWSGGHAVLNQHIFRAEIVGDVYQKELLRLAINVRLDELIAQAHGGVGLRHITKGKLEKVCIALPPLAEQKRIVAKVDELMKLCDDLETQNTRRTQVRTAASRSSLAQLTTSNTRSELEQAWQRVNDHFSALYAVPQTLGELRQTILQLAVQGKLVPQDPKDEPASELLKRDLKLPDGYKRKKKIVKRTPVNAPAALFVKLPSSWEYVIVQDMYDQKLIIDYADGNHGSLYPRKNEFGEAGEIFVSAKDINGGRVYWDRCSKLNTEKAKQLTKGWSEGGDILLTHNATVGRVARVEPEMGRFLLGTSVTYYRLNEQALNSDYFYFVLLSPLWQAQLEAIMAQTTRNQVSIQKQAFFQVPLPPLGEQSRIVVKLDSLFAGLDELATQLDSRGRTTQQLLEAAIHGVLEGV